MSNSVFVDGDWVETKDQDPAGGVRLTQLADVGDGSWRDRSDRHMSERKAHDLRCTFLEKDDVLVARMPDPLGRACLFPGGSQPAVTVVDVAVLRPPAGILPKWLMYTLNAPATRSRIQELQSGTTRKRISRRNLATISVPVPPTSEQRRIVAELDRRFAHIDAAEVGLVRTQRRIALARVALRGETVGGDGSAEDWVSRQLSDVAEVRLGRQRSPRNHSGPSMVPYLRAANVGWSGLILDDTKEMNFTPDEVTTYALRNGDIILSEASGSPGEIGKPAIWRGQLPTVCFQNTLIRIRCGEDVLPEFLAHRLWLEARLAQWAKDVARGVGIYHLGATRLGAWQVRFPSLDEQARIATSIESRLESIDAAERSLQTGIRAVRTLRRAVLQTAFIGNLVTQHADDQPADILLATIRAAADTPSPVAARRKATRKKAST